jgi:kynureninase
MVYCPPVTSGRDASNGAPRTLHSSLPSGAQPVDPLTSWRDAFPILARANYLISNSLGAVPRAAFDSVRDYVDIWSRRGVRAWEEAWWTLSGEMGDLVAPLIGANRAEVVFQPNVTLTHAILFSCFDFESRSRVVTDAMHFPPILYLLDGLVQRGAQVVRVPSDDGVHVETQRLLESIDERTAFVNVSHVLFKSAYVHEVAAIAARAHEVGAAVIVDGYQAVGALPVDVYALGVDAYIGGCLKWLCGGPGAAFLWVHPDRSAEWTPTLTGWMSHTQPFDFAPDLSRRDDVWRFMHGTPNVSALYAARPGLEIIAGVGIDAIRAKSTRQTTRLLDLAATAGWRCTTPSEPDRRGGTVAIDVPHGYEVSKALKSREILCDYRPGAGVRLSPHFYTLDEELDAAIAAIAAILATGEWQAYAGERAVVT